MKKILLVLIFSLSFTQVKMNYFVRQDSIFIGDLVNFVIKLNLESGQIPVFPDLESESETMSIGNKIIGENYVEYELTFWETGKGKIPQIPIQILENNQIKLTLETDSLEVQIYSLLNNSDVAIREIKGMKNIEMISPFERFLIISSILLGLFLAIYFWRKRSQKFHKVKKRKKYIEPIHLQTLNELDKIEIEYPINWENAEKYYLKLTFIFRRYLAEEFYFKALEMTTKEILEFFNNKNFLDESLTRDITELLNRADLSKYAMQVPDKDYFISDKDKAIVLVKSMHEKLKSMTNGHK